MDAAWQRWFEIAGCFDAVLWLTPGQLADVEKRVGTGIRSFVVPHPAPSPSSDAISPVTGRIVMLNSLIPRKRIDHALRALAAVRTTRPEAHLRVYGAGAQLDELERLAADLGIADAVSFEGQTADPARALAEADVFLLASTNEGQGLVILEALSAGVPVVSYDVAYGPRDSLAHGGGLLIADGDVGALATAIEGVITDRALHDRLSADGRAAARKMDAAASMRALGTAVRAALDAPVARRQ
jgi:poly(glycerol-phosphate) alpha-glucosyltransferase